VNAGTVSQSQPQTQTQTQSQPQTQPQTQPQQSQQPAIKLLMTDVQCKSCLKILLSEGALIVHYDKSPLCRKWALQCALTPDELHEAVPTQTIQQLAMEYVRQAITGEKECECKFCHLSFATFEKHLAHYDASMICNRMAHREFKLRMKKLGDK
jgi:hypothetical protein